MLEQRIIKTLQDIVDTKNVYTDKADLILYSYDATQQKFLPEVVVRPASTAEIARVMQLANTERVPVFPRGAGSGFTGGSLPTKGGIVLTTERMDKILEIDDRFGDVFIALRGVSLSVESGFDRPPLEPTVASDALFDTTRRLAGDLGFELGAARVGGASDGNLTAAAGIPTLDGLGPRGGGAHARDEHVLVADLPVRAALVAALVSEP
jgi:hypothetical protein